MINEPLFSGIGDQRSSDEILISIENTLVNILYKTIMNTPGVSVDVALETPKDGTSPVLKIRDRGALLTVHLVIEAEEYPHA